VDEMKEMPWLTIQPRKLRQNLEELLGRLKNLPSQFKSYEAYDSAKHLLQNYSKVEF
jgi:dynein heavy chain 1, cytosolic